MAEKINPIVITKDGKEYILEFSRETVKTAERTGFNKDEAGSMLMNSVPELFYHAFKMHHPTIKRSVTDSILFEDLGGVSDALLERLLQLYDEPYTTLFNESGEPKNPNVTVKF